MTDLPDNPKLDICGCCEDELPKTVLHNPPGQPALDYRIARHWEFLQRLIARLPKWTIPDGDNQGQRPLARLATRTGEDPAIALLDAWAAVGDVLTFYQERIANEGFLRTATERRSVLELARTIGYELAPGVAADAHLVFMVDKTEGAPNKAFVPARTQVQSIPAGEGELPQTFETTEDLEARMEWNTLKPRMTEPQRIGSGTDELFLEGITTQLQPGDPILLVGKRREENPGNKRWHFRFLQTVTAYPDRGYTHITWKEELGHDDKPTVQRAPKVFAFRRRAALFGHNAPDWKTMPEEIKMAYADVEDPAALPADQKWLEFNIQTVDEKLIDLDAAYPKILTGSWIVLGQPDQVELYKVTGSATGSRTDFALTAKTTRLTLDTNESLGSFGLRETVVYAESEELKQAEKPIDRAVGKRISIDLDRRIGGMKKGRRLVVKGKPEDGGEELISEMALVETAADSRIALQAPLKNRYRRATVTINANVVPATHGETVAEEVLGSGDALRANQRFKLNKPPLTYVSAETASGRQSTLTVRVDGIEWQHKPSLFRLGPDSRSYTVRIDNEARASVIFGDGQSGARLPTGQENVVATYRSGIGTDGLVGAKSLSLLKTRPFGIKSVTNPQAASGAENPESLADARRNAPTAVLALDRIVSLQDYEDFARTFAGIGKARAVTLWVGQREMVHITIAGASGEEVDSDSRLYGNLANAIANARDPLQDVNLGSFQPRLFNVEAKVLIDPAYQWEAVKGNIEAALRKAFGFEQRTFGQPVSSAEVITAIHRIEGVKAVDLDALYRVNKSGRRVGKALSAVLTAENARPNRDARRGEPDVLPAELLMINELGIALVEMKP